MLTNDRGEVSDLFGGTGRRASGWRLVDLVERRRFVLFVFPLLP